MIANGLEANRPSGGVERKVPNALMIYSLNKLKANDKLG